ncbi:hypothetical protein DPMN_100014 [Dreissena polymorpha]|uniref:Uncharacterized protein n=1 Tax=Dreissena polymorpha TaxID=45954 RepID=A0A9D4LEZ9_DREPO|nr:hypothetical protein DPMN_100014 [Dreissena polymorpha]
MDRHVPTCESQVTLSSEEVVSITEKYTRQRGSHKTYPQKTRPTTCASRESLGAHFRMYV